MFQSVLLVLSIIMLTMSFVYDKSVKELIENPPPELMELFQDASDIAAETTDTAGDVAARIEQAAKEQAADLDEIEVSVDTALETAGRIEQAIDEAEIPDVVKETANDSKARMEQAAE